MKTILAIVGVLVLAVAVYIGLEYRKIQQAASGPAREIVTEHLVGDRLVARLVDTILS